MQGIEGVTPMQAANRVEANRVPRVRRAVWGVLERVATVLPGIGASFVAERANFASRAREIAKLFHHIQPRLLILGGEMPGYDTGVFVQTAHSQGVPVMVVPSTMSNGLEQAEVYYDDISYHVIGITANLISLLFPKWVRRHKNRRLFRCPPGRILAMEFAGIAPPQPWIFNSGHADAVAMESEAMIDYYGAVGMRHDRMILTGSLSDDVMAKQLRNATLLRQNLCAQLHINCERPIVLTALPPDFFYVTGGRPQSDFKDYRTLVEFWVASLAQLTSCNCLITLHPSVEVDSMRWVEGGNIRIATWKTSTMVPLCDIYVASISSTIRWAIACGKPVVNYDVYRYRYTDFLGVSGVLRTEDQREFRAILERLANDEAYREEVARAQRGAAPYWGLLDGHAGDRMLEVVARLSGIQSVAQISADNPAPQNSVSDYRD